jgi:hypothetical protein
VYVGGGIWGELVEQLEGDRKLMWLLHTINVVLRTNLGGAESELTAKATGIAT